jgi:hypothetical protein
MSFQMKWQQIYRGSMVYVGWMRGAVVYDDNLSQNMCGLVFSHEPQGEKNLLKATMWL